MSCFGQARQDLKQCLTQLYDLMQPFKLASYHSEGTAIRSVAWSQSGAHLSVGLGNGKVRPNGRYCLTYQCCIWSCMTHDGPLQVDLWDISKMQRVRSFPGHRSRVSALSWNSHLLSTGGSDRLILHRDMRVPEHTVARLQGHKSEIAGLKV